MYGLPSLERLRNCFHRDQPTVRSSMGLSGTVLPVLSQFVSFETKTTNDTWHMIHDIWHDIWYLISDTWYMTYESKWDNLRWDAKGKRITHISHHDCSRQSRHEGTPCLPKKWSLWTPRAKCRRKTTHNFRISSRTISNIKLSNILQRVPDLTIAGMFSRGEAFWR